jgi:hypothetical protein
MTLTVSKSSHLLQLVVKLTKHYRTDLPALKIKADIPYNWAVNAMN